MFIDRAIESEKAREKAHKYVFLCGVAFEYDLVSNRTIVVAVIHIEHSILLRISRLYRLYLKHLNIHTLTHNGHNKESCIYNRNPFRGERISEDDDEVLCVWQGWKRFSLDCYAHTKIFETLKIALLLFFFISLLFVFFSLAIFFLLYRSVVCSVFVLFVFASFFVLRVRVRRVSVCAYSFCGRSSFKQYRTYSLSSFSSFAVCFFFIFCSVRF